MLDLGGQVLSQSNAINRYVGKLGDLYPSDPWQAALCDEAMEAVEDITNKIGATLFIPEEQKKAQRKELAEGPIPFYLTRLQQRLEAHGHLLCCQSLNSRGFESVRMGPTPKVRCARSYACRHS